jgi:hydrogenase nickel incorporation protein HypA/HybF
MEEPRRPAYTPMHEVGIAKEAVDTAIEHATKAGAARVLKIKLRIGALSGVVPDALEFAFDVVTKDTAAAGAAFEYEWVAVRCHCATCDEDFEPEDHVYECPKCGGLSWDVRAGRELDLMTVEAE